AEMELTLSLPEDDAADDDEAWISEASLDDASPFASVDDAGSLAPADDDGPQRSAGDRPDADRRPMRPSGRQPGEPAWSGVGSSRPSNDPAAATDLPLFGDDAPLLTLPPTPRPPLAVRRTPEIPRVRPPATASGRGRDQGLDLLDDLVLHDAAPEALRDHTPDRGVREAEASAGLARRALAAGLDLAMLFGIDLGVGYFTLRIASLQATDWAQLPPVPLVVFLLLLKVSYFTAFTALGGQTIGKMATGLRVVAGEGEPPGGVQAMTRTLIGTVSVAAAGLGLLPMLFGPEHRALHDRLTGTRVVGAPGR
ncbi:MAG: RDD family protein, partial [Acidobacteria bacterium]|nr:RDD family protein [Acidobacteriota bacterium]